TIGEAGGVWRRRGRGDRFLCSAAESQRFRDCACQRGGEIAGVRRRIAAGDLLETRLRSQVADDAPRYDSVTFLTYGELQGMRGVEVPPRLFGRVRLGPGD